MQMPAAVESVGYSEGQSKSQFAVSESAPLRAAAFRWAASSWELEAVKARVRASLQSMRAPRWGLLLPVGVGDSEGWSENQLAVTEIALAGACGLY